MEFGQCLSGHTTSPSPGHDRAALLDDDSESSPLRGSCRSRPRTVRTVGGFAGNPGLLIASRNAASPALPWRLISGTSEGARACPPRDIWPRLTETSFAGQKQVDRATRCGGPVADQRTW